MSSAVNIQIVSMPNLAKIESFFKDVSYRETIEYSANFNTRLCIERRLRLPFLDPQTGVAQNHSQLFMDKRQRMPGFRQGQIYTYPAARWRKSRRQYLSKMYGCTHNRFPERPFQALRKEHEALVASGINIGGTVANSSAATVSIGSTNSSSSTLSLSMLAGMGVGVGSGSSAGGASTPTPVAVLNTMHNDTTHDFNGAFSMEESCSLGAAGGDTSDSKDSQLQSQQHQQQHQQSKDDLPKEWFYDEMDMNDVDSLEEPKSPADDEYDYDPRYGNKKRRKRRPGKRSTIHAIGETPNTASSSNARRRSAVSRMRIGTTDAALDASLDAIEAGEIGGTPTTSGSGGGRRSRGAGTRGRRRAKGATSGTTTTAGASGMPSNTCDPPSPGLVNEPPSFESAAAAVGVNVGVGVEDGNAHLRNYRKYL
ncbi:uncharacterized protein LOC6569418 [Drosophila grimshawi]|uniref:GH17804 n=1 Tax=Drosophila grimshawi TaxID=7222 RepID=B4JWR0_DROGR|nr:uncharacterized protein LOC6569418 [Drosophila grimshawi]EDV95186.1 GH17804 [Drosophila grimshawi]